MLQKWIDRGVAYCIAHATLVIVAALVLAALSAIYAVRHFTIDTEINNLISERLPWRQNEIAFQKAFPQTIELILVDVGADSPEAAKAAARDVATACCFFHPIRWRMSPNSSPTLNRFCPA
jgi:predicted RND superfamily exporter protein